MKQVLQHVRSGKLELAEVPEPALRRGGVLVRNAASLISAGTEKMVTEFAGKSMLGKARARPDLVRQVLARTRSDGVVATARTVLSRLDQPIALGYSCAGRVVAVGSGAEDFKVGERVACAGMGYASHASVVFVPYNLTVHVPDAVSDADAAYVTLGAIALQGVRIATPTLGERVAVIGLGLLGQLTVQLLVANGCRVIGIDLDAHKVALARELGAEQSVLRSDDVVRAVDRFTNSVGVDAVIITAAADTNDPTELAGEIARDRGRVVMVGAVRMDVPRRTYYEKELDLRLSRSYGPGRYDPLYEEYGQDYPIGYVRWTERRNMEEFLRLVSVGAVEPSRLTTHYFPIEGAEEAYNLLDSGSSFLGVMLTYPNESVTEPSRSVRVGRLDAIPRTEGIGVIGAGNFARAVLLPHFHRQAKDRLVTVCTSNGATARSAAQRFGFTSCTTDVTSVLEHPQVGAVVIATRHSSHASLTARAMRAGRAVFVEKPLALSAVELDEVMAAQAETGALLVVGFNRRFSPMVRRAIDFVGRDTPLTIDYRVNAGSVPADSWVQDPASGGGRIVGEVCHFVDLVHFLANDLVEEVYACTPKGSSQNTRDTVAITLRTRVGHLAHIGYYASGDRGLPKERIEVFSGGRAVVLDDFRTLTLSADGRARVERSRRQEKGFHEEVASFLAAIESGVPPISPSDLERTTRVTFAIEESLRTGSPIQLQ